MPNRIRKLLHLKEGSSVGFGVTKDGVVLVPCKITVKSPYTEKQWAKIEKLADKKSTSFEGVEDSKKYLKKL